MYCTSVSVFSLFSHLKFTITSSLKSNRKLQLAIEMIPLSGTNVLLVIISLFNRTCPSSSKFETKAWYYNKECTYNIYFTFPSLSISIFICFSLT